MELSQLETLMPETLVTPTLCAALSVLLLPPHPAPTSWTAGPGAGSGWITTLISNVDEEIPWQQN